MRRLRLVAILAALSMLVLLLGAPTAGANQERTYQVTISNLTGSGQPPGVPSEGQPFTPALVATHKGNDGFFTVGKPASFGLKEIAENGNLGPMVNRISTDGDFTDWKIQMGAIAPPVLPGETVSFEINAGPPFNFLSWASMLICTNDGFTGVDSLKLPNEVGASTHVYTNAYDAGTEVNTEDFADMVPPCQVLSGVMSDDGGTDESNDALAEGGVIHHHAGIIGGEDLLSSVHGWADPVARITVERTG